MATQTIETELQEQVSRLPIEQQYKVLAFARSLAVPQTGVPGKSLLSFAGSIDADELKAMQQAIDEDCERIDHHEW